MASVTHFTHFYASPTDALSHFMTYSQVLSSWNKYLNGGKLGTWKFSETRYSFENGWDSLLNSDTFLRKGGTYRLLVTETTFFNVRFADNRHSLRNFWLVFCTVSRSFVGTDGSQLCSLSLSKLSAVGTVVTFTKEQGTVKLERYFLDSGQEEGE